MQAFLKFNSVEKSAQARSQQTQTQMLAIPEWSGVAAPQREGKFEEGKKQDVLEEKPKQGGIFGIILITK